MAATAAEYRDRAASVQKAVNTYCRDEEGFYLDGPGVKEYSQHALREKIGYVSQKATLFAGTVRENIAFGDSKKNLDHHYVDAAYTAQVPGCRQICRKHPQHSPADICI